jgi:uncharacterized protein (DUF983 family)
MPLIRCPHCGEDTLTIAGWADLDHCATCGRALPAARARTGPEVAAGKRFVHRPEAKPRRTA